MLVRQGAGGVTQAPHTLPRPQRNTAPCDRWTPPLTQRMGSWQPFAAHCPRPKRPPFSRYRWWYSSAARRRFPERAAVRDGNAGEARADGKEGCQGGRTGDRGQAAGRQDAADAAHERVIPPTNGEQRVFPRPSSRHSCLSSTQASPAGKKFLKASASTAQPGMASMRLRATASCSASCQYTPVRYCDPMSPPWPPLCKRAGQGSWVSCCRCSGAAAAKMGSAAAHAPGLGLSWRRRRRTADQK